MFIFLGNYTPIVLYDVIFYNAYMETSSKLVVRRDF